MFIMYIILDKQQFLKDLYFIYLCVCYFLDFLDLWHFSCSERWSFSSSPIWFWGEMILGSKINQNKGRATVQLRRRRWKSQNRKSTKTSKENESIWRSTNRSGPGKDRKCWWICNKSLQSQVTRILYSVALNIYYLHCCADEASEYTYTH